MAKQQNKTVVKRASIKKQTTTSKSDTTKIPTPYKTIFRDSKGVVRTGLYGAVKKTKQGYALTSSDSTGKKGMYNNSIVEPARLKRNTERIKEGKSNVSSKDVYGIESPNKAFSEKGKTFKEAPLKSVKKKK